jgi:hypothetical protein
MMAYEQRDNSGSLFRNDRKETEKHPDRTGTAQIDGVMYYVSGWLKTGSKGQFLSLAFKRKDEGIVREKQPGPTISQRATAKIHSPDRITSGLPPKQNILPDDDGEIPF